jgi:hypothetical protein
VVVNNEAVASIGRDGFAQLLERPGGGGMGGDVEVNQPPRSMLITTST